MKKLYAMMISLLLSLVLLLVMLAWLRPLVQAAPPARPLHNPGNCTVTTTNDGGAGSLRACMVQLVAGDVITFDTTIFLPGNPQTITLSNPLPDIITDNVTIDDSNAGVVLDGSGTPEGTNGLVIDGASNVVIRGLQILYFPYNGIELRNGASNNTIGGTNGSPGGACSGECNLISGNGIHGVHIYGNSTTSNIVSGNYIGTNVSGTAAIGNIGKGVMIWDGAQYNVIGGDTTGERNLLSGNGGEGVLIYSSGMSNTVSGNYIGTNASGTAAVGNDGGGIDIHQAGYNVIGGNNATPGGACTGECNLISGNTGDNGISIFESGAHYNTVSGNYIGTNVNGTVALSNTGSGVLIRTDAQYNVIGGNTPEKRNLISGNGNKGISIFESGAMSNTVKGNYIGTDASGIAAIPNDSAGVGLIEGAQHNTIGPDNLIAYNGTDGVSVFGAQHNTVGPDNIIVSNSRFGVLIEGAETMHNTVIGNFIGTNTSGATDMGNSFSGVCIEAASYNIIGGNTPAERNVISGNSGNGVSIGDRNLYSNSMSNTVKGNYIGTNASGTAPIPNDGHGVQIREAAKYNVIGGDTAAERNLISGNGSSGVNIRDNGTMHNTVIGNYIGTNAAGTSGLANTGDGVLLYGGAQRNTVGPDNTIAYNSRFGVLVVGSTCLSNTVTQNSIYSNTEKGIELYDGGNLELFPPIIELPSDTTVKGLAPPNSTVEIFSDDEDEGRVYEGSTTADATSRFTFNKPLGLTGPNTTATATDVDGNTSEFSTAYSVTHDMKLVDIFSPKSRVQVGETVTPTVEVGNAGSSTEANVPVQVRVTSGPGGTEVYSTTETMGSIGPLAYVVVEFDPWTPGTTGSYRLEAKVLLDDDNNGNNSKEVVVAAVTNNPELYIKDNVGDDGSVPQFPCWESPDLWVRHEEDGGEEHQQPIANQTNYVYARIHNIGDVALDNVTVDLYWHEPALAIKCGGWRHIGQATISSLAAGETQIIHLPWVPDVGGHTCLFAQVDSDQDPYSRDHDCYEGVPWDNNLAQRNVDILESAAAAGVGAASVADVRLDVVNVRSKPASVDVVVEKTGAFSGTLTLDLGEELFNRWHNATGGTVEGGHIVAGTTEVQITGSVSGTVMGLPLYGDEEVEVVLGVEWESGLEFEVEVMEWMDGLLIGGNTYQVKLPYQRIYLPILLKGHSGS